MSAEVSAGGYVWFCAECCAGEDGFETEGEADAAADRHDDLNEHGVDR